jgi:hypothetical protein
MAALLPWLLPLTALAFVAHAQTGTPDKFIEAASYAEFADTAVHCGDRASLKDPIGQARLWTEKAIATVAAFHSSDADERVRVLKFANNQKALLAAMRTWERFQKDGEKKVRQTLNDGKLETAAAMLKAGGPACCPAMVRLRALIDSQRQAFQAAIDEGDRWSRSNPPKALERYRMAGRLNREDAAPPERIRQLTVH